MAETVEQTVKAYHKDNSVIINGWTNKILVAVTRLLPPSLIARILS